MTKAVIYARVSSNEQERDGFSIPAQLDLLKDYAKKNNFEIVKIYEESQTAKKAGRIKFNEMLQFLKSSKDVKTILVEKTDRLYRNFKDYVEIDDTEFEIHLVKENEIIGRNATSHQKFIHGIKVLMAKNYIDNLSEETKKGSLKKAQEGYFVAQVPYGYKKLDPRTTVIDEEKAQFVRRAYEIYSEGELSLSKTREKLYDEGYIYRPNSPKITVGQLELILKNINYTGVLAFKGEYYEGKHEPIISSELFKKVQKAFKKDNKPQFSETHKFAFAGMFTCAECGCTITAEIKKGKYIYYHCTGNGGKCSQKPVYIREEEIAEQLDEAIKAITISDEHFEYIKQGLKESLQEKNRFSEEELNRLNIQAKKLKDRLDKLFIAKLDGEINQEEWQEKNLKWKDELEEINNKIKSYNTADAKYYEEGIKIIELLKNAYSLYSKQNNSEKRKMLKYVLSNCTINNKKVSYDYNLPFAYFVNFDSCQEKYARRDSNARPSA